MAWWYSWMRPPRTGFASNPAFVEAGGGRYRRCGVGRALVQALVGTMPGVTRRVLAKDSPRVTRSYNQDLVGQFAVQCPGEALADRIRPRCAWWRVISLVSASNTASNIVVYFVSRPLIRNRSSSSRSPRSIARFRGLLGDPAAGRVGRHAGDMQLPGRMPAKISTYKRLGSTVGVQEVTRPLRRGAGPVSASFKISHTGECAIV